MEQTPQNNNEAEQVPNGIHFYYATEYDTREVASDRIDWRGRWLARIALQNNGNVPQPLRVKTGDGYDAEVTPQIAGMVVNGVDDNMDALWVHDTRDNSKWVKFRDEIGSELYTALMRVLRIYGKIEAANEVDPEIAEIYMKRKAKDLEGFDTVPDDWK